MYLMFGDIENFSCDLSKWKLNFNVKIDNMFKSVFKVDVEKLVKIWSVLVDKFGKKFK